MNTKNRARLIKRVRETEEAFKMWREKRNKLFHDWCEQIRKDGFSEVKPDDRNESKGA